MDKLKPNGKALEAHAIKGSGGAKPAAVDTLGAQKATPGAGGVKPQAKDKL